MACVRSRGLSRRAATAYLQAWAWPLAWTSDNTVWEERRPWT
ncbi:hypothetical protein [Azospirillum doebereinerae]